jgi:hypothetical protein
MKAGNPHEGAMSRIFISHSSANNVSALAVARWLEENG